MTKHLADRPRTQGDGRVRHYTDIERRTSDAPGRVAKTLHRQETTRGEEARVKRYADIERAPD